ncbi:hypothetical protein AURDEDRAFT_176920 [Auricularia subglabra TFB-10046 SS5]|uniref:Uncharacterized protein n=1 Tax=Auricularia subglabra (strain TFB-10046 / SS5) TaxID=717982 RepID=J0WNS1_AURST|nr:hypothetical protein AURDEDRAFT_176920 [Auricularia subglabra TFB-10046 SS5]
MSEDIAIDIDDDIPQIYQGTYEPLSLVVNPTLISEDADTSVAEEPAHSNAVPAVIAARFLLDMSRMFFLRVLIAPNVRLRLDTTPTHENIFGVSRRDFGRPTSTPDPFTPLEEMLGDNEAPSDGEPAHHWSFDSHPKENRRALVRDVLLHKLFEAEELRGVSFDALDHELGRWDVEDALLSLGPKWKRSSPPGAVEFSSTRISALCLGDLPFLQLPERLPRGAVVGFDFYPTVPDSVRSTTLASTD